MTFGRNMLFWLLNVLLTPLKYTLFKSHLFCHPMKETLKRTKNIGLYIDVRQIKFPGSHVIVIDTREVVPGTL